MSDHICLIVDDEPLIRTYVRVILEGEKLQTVEANNAAEAMRIVQKLGGRLDLVVSDIKMPGDIDGIDLAYSIRNCFPSIPVILISGYADEDSIRNAGLTFELIRKPFVPETLTKAARRALLRERGI
jgi:DNA-binding NtrC family response regulator